MYTWNVYTSSGEKAEKKVAKNKNCGSVENDRDYQAASWAVRRYITPF